MPETTTQTRPDTERTDLIRIMKRLTQGMAAHYGACPEATPAEVEEMDEIVRRLAALEKGGEIYNLTIVADELIRLTQENAELRHYLRETAALLAGAVGSDLGDLCWPEFTVAAK